MAKRKPEDQGSLDSHRHAIDDIDKQIHDLLVQRISHAREIAQLKSGESEPIFYRPDREAAVLRSVLSREDDSALAPLLARVFREIMSATLAAERPVRVAISALGGSEQLDCVRQMGFAAIPLSQKDVQLRIQAVRCQDADLCRLSGHELLSSPCANGGLLTDLHLLAISRSAKQHCGVETGFYFGRAACATTDDDTLAVLMKCDDAREAVSACGYDATIVDSHVVAAEAPLNQRAIVLLGGCSGTQLMDFIENYSAGTDNCQVIGTCPSTPLTAVSA